MRRMSQMRYTNVFLNPKDKGILRFTVDSNPEEHYGYSENINFNPEEHIQRISGKWDLKEGEIIVRFVNIREGRTKTVVRYQEEDFSCKIDDVDTEEGDYHIEVNEPRVEEHIKNKEDLHPASFCLIKLLDELVERRDKEIPIYFFFGGEVEKDPKVKRLILGRKSKDVNLARYCFAVAHLIEKERELDLGRVKKWRENKLIPALEEVNRSKNKGGGVEIPWSTEKRVFPIPVQPTEGDEVILECIGKENQEIPEFLPVFKEETS